MFNSPSLEKTILRSLKIINRLITHAAVTCMTMNKSNKDATCLVNSPSLENSMVFAYPSATAESVHMRGQEKNLLFHNGMPQ